MIYLWLFIYSSTRYLVCLHAYNAKADESHCSQGFHVCLPDVMVAMETVMMINRLVTLLRVSKRLLTFPVVSHCGGGRDK